MCDEHHDSIEVGNFDILRFHDGRYYNRDNPRFKRLKRIKRGNLKNAF
ncbi:MAG: hypothetical protein ACFFAS_20405 [Promethearchaeota archaeon]